MSEIRNFPRISAFLWFDSNAEEAVEFYLSVFRNSRRLNEVRAPEGMFAPKGSVLTIAFELDGQMFTALNGGQRFQFTPAVSFVVWCESQEEIDDYWAKLSAGGREVECGWLTDKFGVSWQVVPKRIGELIKHPKAMKAMLKMVKLDLAKLELAAQS